MEIVIDVLQKATSQNPDLIKVAEQHLKSLETERGYYPMLMAIVLNRSIDVNIRWLASVCLKNGIDRYWRKTAPNAMTNEERIELKQKFLLCFDEPINLVASQIAVIIAKVSRLDWPDNWPELFHTLLNVIQNPEDLYQQRGLLILYQVVKTLASRRLPGDQHVFQQMTISLFPIALHLWRVSSTAFVQGPKGPCPSFKIPLVKCHLCLKILRKLVVYGYKKPSEDPEAVNFLQMIFQQFEPFVECRKCLVSDDDSRELCEKYLVLLTKVLDNVLEHHTVCYIQFIRPTLECAVVFCFSQKYEDRLFELFSVGLLNLVKNILTWFGGTGPLSDEQLNAFKCINSIKKEFFSPSALKEIVHQLVYRYFLLTPEDIQLWNENPEEYAAEKFGESCKFHLKPCTETLYLALFKNYGDIIRPLVLQMIESLQIMNRTDFDTIRKKEAIFNAIGLAIFDLYDEVCFDQWLTEIVIPEWQVVDPNYFIIRRRVIWAIGELVGVKYPTLTVPLMYSIIVQALEESENIVVRLTAANTLKSTIDSLNFNQDEIEPYLRRFFSSMFNLLKQVQECDLKMSVLDAMTFIIERVRKKVRNHVMSLATYLQELWATCSEHVMLCCAILSCFKEIVYSLRKESTRLHLIIIPMITYGTDLNNRAHVYLMEDSLMLWRSLLETTHLCTPELMRLVQNMFPLFELGRESFDNCLALIESYILLSPKEFLGTYGEHIVKAYMSLQSDLPEDFTTSFLFMTSHALNIFPMESPVLFRPMLSRTVTSIFENQDYGYRCSRKFSILSQVIYQNQSFFANLLESISQECGQEVNKTFQYFIEAWLKVMPSTSLIMDRKMMALALLRLLTTNCSVVHDNIPGILLAVVEAINDVTRPDRTENQDLLYIPEQDRQRPNKDIKYGDDDDDEDGNGGDYDGTEEGIRTTLAKFSDPVYTVILIDYLKLQMNNFKIVVGQTKFEDIMSTVDIETSQQLKAYLQS